MFTRITFAAVAVLALTITVFSTGDALAGKGGGQGSSIWILDTYTTAVAGASADGVLNFSDPVGFGYNSDKATSIQLWCYQPVGSDNLVFADSRMLFEGGWGYGEPFNLGPSAAWTSGEATCKAMLGHRSASGKYMVEASLTFDVAP